MKVGKKRKGSLYILDYISELIIKIWQSEKRKEKKMEIWRIWARLRNHIFQVQISPKKTKH
jgi:hypothetical protein